MLTNKQIYNELSEYVSDELLAGNSAVENIEFGPLEVNYFSFCFWVNATFDSGQQGMYVKIPKIILYNKENRQIMPLSSQDRKLAEDEYHSLVHLSKHWPNNEFEVHFIKPRAFIKKNNAIITERVYARHFFKIYKKFDIIRKFNNKPNFTHNILSRLGATLSMFHQKSIRECRFNIESIIIKIENCCSQLKYFGISKEYLDNIVQKFNKMKSYELLTHQSNTLKGFDVRQVFINNEEKIFLLDPGKIKTNYVEMDLARFIVTCRILYWGSILLFLRISPNPSYEESFLNSYYGNNKRPIKVLSILIIKELLKHWRMAHKVTDMKSWPSPIKIFLKKNYIDPFYKSQINTELPKLGI